MGGCDTGKIILEFRSQNTHSYLLSCWRLFFGILLNDSFHLFIGHTVNVSIVLVL
jgi:hypothetical protein